MGSPDRPLAWAGRRKTIVLAVVMAAVGALAPAGVLAAEPSVSPDASASPAPMSVSPGPTTAKEAMCASVDDLGLIVGFLRATDAEADGWLPLFVGAVAGLAEARTLLGEVDATYRPLVDDLVDSLQDLVGIVDQVRGLDTLGSQVAAVGEAITAVGVSMDALSVALREPCPTSP